jgi:hypothetical protein
VRRAAAGREARTRTARHARRDASAVDGYERGLEVLAGARLWRGENAQESTDRRVEVYREGDRRRDVNGLAVGKNASKSTERPGHGEPGVRGPG